MSRFRTFLDYVWKPLSVVPLVLAVQDTVGHFSTIVGPSMQPTLNPNGPDGTHHNDRVFVDRWSIHNHSYKRGDVVSLRYVGSIFAAQTDHCQSTR